MKAAFEIIIKKGNKGLLGLIQRASISDYLWDEVVICTGDTMEEMNEKAWTYARSIEVDIKKYPNATITVGRRLHWNFRYGGIRL